MQIFTDEVLNSKCHFKKKAVSVNVNGTVSLFGITAPAGATDRAGCGWGIALSSWSRFHVATSAQCHELDPASWNYLGASPCPPGSCRTENTWEQPLLPDMGDVPRDPHVDQCPCEPGQKQPLGFSKQIIRKWFPLSS